VGKAGLLPACSLQCLVAHPAVEVLEKALLALHGQNREGVGSTARILSAYAALKLRLSSMKALRNVAGFIWWNVYWSSVNA